MPIKNNRNSRDDKSKKVDRSAKSPKDFAAKKPGIKPERTDALNMRPRKLFGEGGDTPLKGGFGSVEGKSDRAGKGRGFDKPSDNLKERKYSKPDNKFGGPDDRKAGKSEERKTFRPAGDKKFGKSADKPFGRSEDRKFSKSGGGKFTGSEDNRGARKVWTKSSDETRGERAPSSYGRPDTGRPYKKEYKPKTEGFEERKRTSETRLDRKPGGKGKKTPDEKFTDGLIRLNRYIANAGICSRRKADELIEAGVVSVNGEVVSELGTKVDPSKDIIRYNGETLKREKMVYVLLNKPKDYITTTDDPQERRTVMHLVEKASRERIYPVGRLDRNTTGLLLMTNDGALAEKLSHPRNSITKIYQVELNKNLSQGDLNKIGFGIELEDGIIKPDAVSYVQGGSKNEIGIQIHSGRNRIVRRIFEHLGYEVVKLDRVVYGNLTKKDLTRGRWRYLDEKEIIQLKHLIS